MVAAGGLQMLLVSSVCGWDEAAMMFFTGLSVSCGCHVLNDWGSSFVMIWCCDGVVEQSKVGMIYDCVADML